MNNELKRIRKKILYYAYRGQEANLQSAFSALETIWVLYNKVMKKNTSKRSYFDNFILSKGQASLAQYVVLEDIGLISEEALETYCKFNSPFGAQADRCKFDNFIETSTGSLGHGLPMAVGIALAKKTKGIDSNVFCLCGDGEFNEGTMWESCMLASKKKLRNLKIIIENNNDGTPDLARKLEAFGITAYNCIDGHDTNNLSQALSWVSANPMAFILRTIRGYGCHTLANDNSWWHKSPNLDELFSLVSEVDRF